MIASDRILGAMRLIEEIAAERCEEHESLGSIYKIAHTINSPKCSKNHPQWEEDLNEALREREDQCQNQV